MHGDGDLFGSARLKKWAIESRGRPPDAVARDNDEDDDDDSGNEWNAAIWLIKRLVVDCEGATMTTATTTRWIETTTIARLIVQTVVIGQRRRRVNERAARPLARD